MAISQMKNKKYFAFTFIFLNINYLLNVFLNWPLLSVSGIKGASNYSDLSTTLEQVNCGQKTCANYIYGELFARVARSLEIYEIPINLLANILILLFITSVALISSSAISRYGLLAINLIAISPATLLLIERANIDILIFILCFLATFLFRDKLKTLALALLAMATLVKFYPILALWNQFESMRKNMKSKLATLSVVAFVLSISYLALLDVMRVSSNFPANWNASFGLPIVMLWISFGLKEIVNVTWEVEDVLFPIFGIATSLLVWGILKKVSRVGVSLSGKSLLRNPLFIAGLTCYVFGVSFDYRLVFLLIPCAQVLSGRESMLGRKFLLLMIASYCTTTNFGIDIRFLFPSLQILGDVALFLLLILTIFEIKPRVHKAAVSRE